MQDERVKGFIIEEIAREKGKTLSAVIQDALRLAREERLKKGISPDSGLLEQ